MKKAMSEITSIAHNIMQIRFLPRTIQLPITGYCNSRCVTCNVWRKRYRCHIDPQKLGEALKDPYFKRVSSVGINGGEPSLHPKFIKVVEAVLQLPRLKDIYIISNGMRADLLFPKLIEATDICRKNQVCLHLTISLDGIRQDNDKVRGVDGAFSMAWKTIQCIAKDPKRYCDHFNVGYTISKNNPFEMIAVKALLKEINVSPYFHLAVPNKRIGTFDDSGYSVLNDNRSSFLAREFFYSEFVDEKKLRNKLKNYINFYYLNSMENKRIAMCSYLRRDITISEDMGVYLCATASEKIGSLEEMTMSDIAKKGGLDIERANIRPLCDHCIHYVSVPTFEGIFLFGKEMLAKINILLDLICARLHL